MHALLFLSVLLALPASGKTLVEQAYERGELDLETALLYQLQARRDPDALPARYREEPTQAICGTPLLLQALEVRRRLSPDYARRLAKMLVRPGSQREVLTRSGQFRIHYDLTGPAAVERTDQDGNSLPDFVDEVATTLERVGALEVRELGFQAPPADGLSGGGPEYDVYIVELGRAGAYGYTYPESGGNTSQSYLELDNNYTDSIYRQTRGIDALHVTVAHEYNHAIQFGYYQGTDGVWWQEATSTWMEDVAYPEVDDYLQYVSSFLLHPEQSLDSGNRFATDFRIYGAAIWAHYLDQRHDRDLMRLIWEEMGQRGSASMEVFDRVLRDEAGTPLGDAVAEFAVWNYFTGHRHRPGYYAEGAKYPAVRLDDIHLDPSAPKVPVEHSVQVDHLGSAYLHLEPELQADGGVILDYEQASRGTWSRQLILAGRDSVSVEPVTGTPVTVPSWNRFEDVVLVLTVTNDTGFGYDNAVSVQYDPELLDEPLPAALRLEPSYPNPFLPGEHGATTFRFDLDRASPATFLSIFGADGRLVRRFDLEGLPPRRGHRQTWDGRSQAGELVASGVYYGVLDAGGRRVRTRVAVVRQGAQP
ncbi:MAG: MXAN_6640 family putative metalloprotease [Candidatus Latescibacterota bacterium]